MSKDALGEALAVQTDVSLRERPVMLVKLGAGLVAREVKLGAGLARDTGDMWAPDDGRACREVPTILKIN